MEQAGVEWSLRRGRHAHATWGRHELTPRGELTRRHEVTPRGELTRRHEVTPSLESRELTRQVEQVPGHDVTPGVSPVARGSQVAQVPGHDATHPQPKPPVNDVTRRQRRARSPATEDQLADDQADVLAQENKGQHAAGASATQDVTQDALVASMPMSPPVGGG